MVLEANRHFDPPEQARAGSRQASAGRAGNTEAFQATIAPTPVLLVRRIVACLPAVYGSLSQ
jgi:hypothetical protein